jgi:carbon starvation protein
MTPLLMLVAALAVLLVVGSFYSRFLARRWGEDASRTTPAVTLNDGRDYVPTPTPIVFAHHFASIAGAGPIIGPVIALCFGWGPAILWVVLGGLLIGGVHDYLAAFMATREGGHSVATVARRLLGDGPFVALVIFLLVTLALVCATFLNLSATALTSMVANDRLGLTPGHTLFRMVGAGASQKVVIGGIASTSVIVITLVAPLMGWLYLRKKVPVWICSLLALAVCAVSIAIGVFHPLALSEGPVIGSLTGTDLWKLILGGYVLVAAGVPVWIFLQSRDFINVHILYAGLAGLVVTLALIGLKGGEIPPAEAIPALDLASGQKMLGACWPALFITIACGAVSGFHSLCAGGTTCKQLNSERSVRRVGYWAMLLETFLAVCVIAVLVIGLRRVNYFHDVHPLLLGLRDAKPNPILGFAMAVGNAGRAAFGVPVAVGALGGMVLLEGFLVTTLDTAVRLMRYLLEEVWHVVFGAATPTEANAEVSGACGMTTSLEIGEAPAAGPARARPPLARILEHYWVNSGLAVGLTLWFAFSSGIMSLWHLFATANQLLAAFVLLLGSLWLLRRGRTVWLTLIPAFFMLATTAASLRLLVISLWPGKPTGNATLFSVVVVLIGLTLYLVAAGAHGWIAARSRQDAVA